MKRDLVIILNGGGTNGAELKGLYKKLSLNPNYFVYYPGYFPGCFVGEYFPKSTTKDFFRFIDETLEMIDEDFGKVYLIGYSLGACTAAIISAKSDRLEKIVLIAPIIKNPKYSKFLRGLTKSLAYSKNLTRVQKLFYNEFIIRFSRVPKIHVFHLQLYLFRTRNYLKKIKHPTLIVETLNDEIVKKKSIDFLVKNINNTVERHSVESSHFLFFDKQVRNDVINKIVDYIKED